MRIVINGRFFSQPTTGVQRVAAELTRALDALAAARPELDVALALPKNASPPTSLSNIRPLAVGRMTGHAWEQAELPGIVRGAWLLNLCNTGPLAVRRQLALIHDAQVFTMGFSYSWAFRTAYRVLLPRLARRARLVATVSANSRSELARHGVETRGGVHILPNGADHIDSIVADPATLQKHGLRPKGYILALGSLAPHKNIEMLLRAAAERRTRDVELVVAGGGAEIFARRQLASAEGVRMLGRVSDPELKALYENAMALAFPSLTEGFGLPAVEAMRCGCPVVASTGGAIPEVCGDAALYVPPTNQAGWSRALDQIASEDALRARLAAAGRERAAPLTWRRTATALLEALEQADAAASRADAGGAPVSPAAQTLREGRAHGG